MVMPDIEQTIEFIKKPMRDKSIKQEMIITIIL